MAMVSTTRRAWLYALLLFSLVLSSCSPPSEPVWEVSHEACLSSCKITYPCLNEFSGLGVEFVRTPKREQFFILVYSFPLEKGEVEVEIDGKKTVGYVFEGGQKIALNEEASQYLFKAFHANQTVKIRVGRFQAQVPPQAFQEAYQEEPPFNIPIEKYF